MTEYAIVEHYPDGNSSIIALVPTLKKAQAWIRTNYAEDTCTIQQVHTTTLINNK